MQKRNTQSYFVFKGIETMELNYAVLTCVGTREINEDAVKVRQEGEKLLAVVADGLGGHDRGEVASEVVTSSFVDNYKFEENKESELPKAARRAQQDLMEAQETMNGKNAMKTTAVVLCTGEEDALFLHVGDSRGYVFYKWGRISRTRDHSLPQMLALSGKIKEKEIRYHQDRNQLLRVFGTSWDKDMFEVSKEIRLKKVKAFLLCSDGFWELIEEKQMKQCLKKSATPQEWLEKMTEIVEQNGKGQSMDNYTAAAVFVK